MPVLFGGTLALLGVIAISRYDPTSLIFRGNDAIDFFGWFWRYRLAAGATFVDVLLAAVVAAAAIECVRRGWRSSHLDAVPAMLALLVGVSAAITAGWAGPQDSLHDVLFQCRNYLYFMAIYFAASRISWTEGRLRRATVWIVLLSLAAAVLSLWETSTVPTASQVSKAGRSLGVRDIADVPFLLFSQFWLLMLIAERGVRFWWQKVPVFGALAYGLYQVFTGVGKTLLVVYPAVLAYIVWSYRLHLRRVFWTAGAVIAAILFAGFAIAVWTTGEVRIRSPLYVYTTFNMEDLSVATRIGQAENFALNLYERGAVLQGIGIGRKWYTYVPVPEDRAAYPAAEWQSRWHLGAHVPLLRLGLDFGLGGLAVIGILILLVFREGRRFLVSASVTPAARAFIQAALLVLAFQVVINSLIGPKTNLLAGFLLGAISGAIDAVKRGTIQHARRH